MLSPLAILLRTHPHPHAHVHARTHTHTHTHTYTHTSAATSASSDLRADAEGGEGGEGAGDGGGQDAQDDLPHCGVCHVPYTTSKPPFEIKLSLCAVCRWACYTCMDNFNSLQYAKA